MHIILLNITALGAAFHVNEPRNLSHSLRPRLNSNKYLVYRSTTALFSADFKSTDLCYLPRRCAISQMDCTTIEHVLIFRLLNTLKYSKIVITISRL